MGAHFDAFARAHPHLVVDRKSYEYDVDPQYKHKCDACGTMRVTSTLFKLYDTDSKEWFFLASNCFFKIKHGTMPDEIREEARERWEAQYAGT